MSLTISIFAVLVFIIIVNTSLDHLFNWWFREVYKNMDEADYVLKQVEESGIDLGYVYQRLEDEGIQKFITPFKKGLQQVENT